MLDYSFQTLHADDGDRVIFRGVTGSRAYGTNRAGSDEDVRGVFLVPPVEYALLCAPPPQVADERNDRVYYSLRRFAELAAGSNPNALELFWLPPDCILFDTPRFARLRANRSLFLSRRAVDTHIGYALVPTFFDPRGAAWHHLSMQRSALADLAPDGTIRIKKLCYALRSALSVRWIATHAAMPPVPFPELFAASNLDSAPSEAIDAVLAAKRDASERDRIALPPVLDALFTENERLVPTAVFPNRDHADVDELDEIFRIICECAN